MMRQEELKMGVYDSDPPQNQKKQKKISFGYRSGSKVDSSPGMNHSFLGCHGGMTCLLTVLENDSNGRRVKEVKPKKLVNL